MFVVFLFPMCFVTQFLPCVIVDLIPGMSPFVSSLVILSLKTPVHLVHVCRVYYVATCVCFSHCGLSPESLIKDCETYSRLLRVLTSAAYHDNYSNYFINII